MLSIRTACVLPLPASERLLDWAEACFRFTPQIAVSREAIFLEVGKCHHLYREAGLGLRLQALGARFAVTSYRWAVAPDVPTALAFARFGFSGTGDTEKDSVLRAKLPVLALRDFSDPFGGEVKDRGGEISRLIETLEKLGISNLGEFLRLPSRGLPSRFGQLGIHLQQQINLASYLPWPSFAPRERVSERGVFEAEEFFRELEPLFEVLRPLVDRAMSRLRGRGLRASKVRLAVELENYSSLSSQDKKREWSWALALPQGTSTALLPILRERLSGDLARNPFGAPVKGLEFEILESVPGRSTQRDLLGGRDGKCEEERESWNSLFACLVEKLGVGRVFQARMVARYLPEKAWEKAQLEVGDPSDLLNAWLPQCPERPLRVLKNPAPLEHEGEWLMAGGERAWRVASVEGPEILSGEWWFQEPQRSYFRVRAENRLGSIEDLWLYRVPGAGTFFLHGVFD
jgi:protein ImuB